MQYRLMTKNKTKVTALGFGLMRPSLVNGDISMIDKDKTLNLLKYAYDNGVNYFDTAYVYHNETSEEILGDFLQTIARDSVYVDTKFPMWNCEKYDDYDKFFKIQLERLKTDYIDFYLTHYLTKERFEEMKELDVFKFFHEKKKKVRLNTAVFLSMMSYAFSRI